MTREEHREYLRSKEWGLRRLLTLQVFGHRCSVCNTDKKPLDVHHRTYENYKEELPIRDLVVLCRSCHSLYEVYKKL